MAKYDTYVCDGCKKKTTCSFDDIPKDWEIVTVIYGYSNRLLIHLCRECAPKYGVVNRIHPNTPTEDIATKLLDLMKQITQGVIDDNK